jgi:hypothetical protein
MLAGEVFASAWADVARIFGEIYAEMGLHAVLLCFEILFKKRC